MTSLAIYHFLVPASRQLIQSTDQPRLNNRCYSEVWAVVAGMRAGPKLAEGRAGPQNGLECGPGRAKNFQPVHISSSNHSSCNHCSWIAWFLNDSFFYLVSCVESVVNVLVYCCFVSSYDEGEMYGRPPTMPPGDMWGYRPPPFDMPFDPRWARGMHPPPFMPPPPDFRLPVNCSCGLTDRCSDHVLFVQ